jgi:hypothetical protein
MSRLRQLYAEKGAPAWSWLVATLNDPGLIAVVLFCLIILVVSASRLRWNEWYFATHPVGVERPGQVVAGSRERAELQAPTHAAPGAAPLCFVHTCFGL